MSKDIAEDAQTEAVQVDAKLVDRLRDEFPGIVGKRSLVQHGCEECLRLRRLETLTSTAIGSIVDRGPVQSIPFGPT